MLLRKVHLQTQNSTSQRQYQTRGWKGSFSGDACTDACLNAHGSSPALHELIAAHVNGPKDCCPGIVAGLQMEGSSSAPAQQGLQLHGGDTQRSFHAASMQNSAITGSCFMQQGSSSSLAVHFGTRHT